MTSALRAWLAALLMFAFAVHAQEAFEAEVVALESEPAGDPGGIVFIGSSSIRMWSTLAEDFPQHRVFNRGFGGSELRDATRLVPRLVQPHQPRLVVLYAGDNDLANGRTPAQVEADFVAFVKALRAHDRAVKVALISIKPSPARAALLPAMRDANARLQRVAQATPGVAFIDVFTPMLGADGAPRRELFIEDELHLSAAGYRLWAKEIAPFLAPPG